MAILLDRAKFGFADGVELTNAIQTTRRDATCISSAVYGIELIYLRALSREAYVEL